MQKLEELRKQMIVKLGSTVVDTRPEWGAGASDENIINGAIATIAVYLQKKDFPNAFAASFCVAFTMSELLSAMMPVYIDDVLRILPEKHRNEENVKWIGLCFTSMVLSGMNPSQAILYGIKALYEW